ncbi:MAG: hypothetical protein KatS3mg132_798 [Limisphaera sp.]|nr:MAG: hypothetical protein KatS3mg132_798 [Limisphaera sp.]
MGRPPRPSVLRRERPSAGVAAFLGDAVASGRDVWRAPRGPAAGFWRAMEKLARRSGMCEGPEVRGGPGPLLWGGAGDAPLTCVNGFARLVRLDFWGCR